MENVNKKRGRPSKIKDMDTPFAIRLRELGENMTHQEIADGVGVSRQTIGQFMLGNTRPDIETLGKLADFFQVSTDYLLCRTEIKNPNEIDINISEQTGLSDESISRLKDCSDFNLTQIEQIELIKKYSKNQNNDLLKAALDIDESGYVSESTSKFFTKTKTINALLEYDYDEFSLTLFKDKQYKIAKENNIHILSIIKDLLNLKYLDDKEILVDLDGDFDIVDKNSAILSGNKTYSISLKSTIEQNLFEELRQQIVILRDIYK